MNSPMFLLYILVILIVVIAVVYRRSISRVIVIFRLLAYIAISSVWYELTCKDVCTRFRNFTRSGPSTDRLIELLKSHLRIQNGIVTPIAGRYV